MKCRFTFIQSDRKRSIVRVVSCPRRRHNVPSQGSNLKSSTRLFEAWNGGVARYASFFATHIVAEIIEQRLRILNILTRNIPEISYLNSACNFFRIELKYVRSASLNTLEYSRCTSPISVCAQVLWRLWNLPGCVKFCVCTRLNTLIRGWNTLGYFRYRRLNFALTRKVHYRFFSTPLLVLAE